MRAPPAMPGRSGRYLRALRLPSRSFGHGQAVMARPPISPGSAEEGWVAFGRVVVAAGDVGADRSLRVAKRDDAEPGKVG